MDSRLVLRSAARCLMVSSLLSLAACGGGGGSPAAKPPVISNTVFSTSEDTTLSGRITLSDPEGGALQVAVTSAAAHGILTGPDAGGAFTYVPVANFNGADAFTISATDAQSLSTSAVVSITVLAVNDLPVAAADTALTAPAVAVVVPVLANDSDAETQQLQLQIAEQATGGVAVANTDGTVTFTPNAGFAGVTQFKYRALDAESAASALAPVTVDVRPLNSVVYYTASGPNQRVMQVSPASTQRLSPAIAAGNRVEDLQVSANGRTALWRVRDANGGLDAWYFKDFSANDLQPGFINGTGFYTQIKLSPTGTHVLVPYPKSAGNFASTEVSLQDLATGAVEVLPESGQISEYEFAPDGQSVGYRTNLPAHFDTDVSYRRVTLAAPQTAVTIAGPMSPTDTGGNSIRFTPDGTRLLFSGFVNNWGQAVLRVARVDGSSNAQIIGPFIPAPALNILGFNVASTSRHAALALRTPAVTPQNPLAAYVIDLDSGAYAHVGPALATGSRISVPVFNRDGSKVAVAISTSSATAIFEASVQNPGATMQVSPTYPARVNIRHLSYAAGDRIIYTADVAQAEIHDLFVIANGNAQRLNADLGTSLFLTYEYVGFGLSVDGRTVVYAQPETPAEPLSLFLVDVSTPGLPLKVGGDVSGVPHLSQAYVLR